MSEQGGEKRRQAHTQDGDHGRTVQLANTICVQLESMETTIPLNLSLTYSLSLSLISGSVGTVVIQRRANTDAREKRRAEIRRRTQMM